MTTRLRAPFLLLPLLLAICLPRPARADAPTDAPVAGAIDSGQMTPAPTPLGAWYGWQVLAVDAASLGLTVGCLASDSVDKDVCAIPIFGYLLGPPALHTGHQGLGRGAVSLATRVVLPMLGGLIGAAVADCPETRDPFDFCGLDSIGLGLISGAAAAAAIDAVWAFDSAEPPAPLTRGTAALTPTLTFNRASAGVGLVGRF